jgi:hypothetical protein
LLTTASLIIFSALERDTDAWGFAIIQAAFDSLDDPVNNQAYIASVDSAVTSNSLNSAMACNRQLRTKKGSGLLEPLLPYEK